MIDTTMYSIFDIFQLKIVATVSLTSIKWVYHRLNASKTRHPGPFFRGDPFQGANIWYFLQK